MRFTARKARNLNSLIENQDDRFQIATALWPNTDMERAACVQTQSFKASYPRRNNSFKSAEGALLARRLNVPFALISRDARRTPPHAASASPEPTEMRRTPTSA